MNTENNISFNSTGKENMFNKMKYSLLLFVLTMVLNTGLLVAQCTSTSGQWTKDGNVYKTFSDGVEATVSFTSQGYAAVPSNQVLTTSSFATSTSFWEQNLMGKPSLGFSLVWDIYPESQETVIGTYDDRGKGTLVITFNKPVNNPKIHIDKLGGAGGTSYYTKSNSAELTLLTSGVSMSKLTGTDDFIVTSTKINREAGISTNLQTEANQSKNIGTAAGTVQITGVVNQLVFEWTGIGVEGIGYDAIEMILEYCGDIPDSTNSPNFDFVINQDCPNQTVNFFNTSTNVGPGVTYNWYFGDGNTSTLSNPNHVYASAGTYDVTLILNDGQGNVKTVNRAVTIGVCNACSLMVNYSLPPLICSGNPLEFTNTSNHTSWQTNFVWKVYKKTGNNTWILLKETNASGISSLEYTFSALGEYQVVLSGTDPSCGGKRYKSKLVSVGEECPAICTAVSGTWTKTGSVFKTVSDGVGATVSFTSQGYATVPINQVSTNSLFGANNFWEQNLVGKPSLGFNLVWDIYPEAQGTVIGPYDDRGKGTLKIVFDQPVYNPKLHIDKLGGAGTNYYTIANSAEFTLLTPGVTMSKASGTNDFIVSSAKINREAGITTNLETEANQSRNIGTSAGTVQFTGLVNELVFEWTGIGVEGLGYDAIEIILEYCSETPDTTNLPDFDFVVNQHCPNQTVNFINTSTNVGVGATYQWNFGDGSTSTLGNPSHVYTSVGTYEVTLEINDGQGNLKNIQKTITILDCNDCSLTVNFDLPSLLCSGSSIAFTNTSSNITSQTTFVWDVYKKVSNHTWNLVKTINTSGLSPLNHNFSNLGEYQVVLSGSDPSCGGKRSKNQLINVNSECPVLCTSISGTWLKDGNVYKTTSDGVGATVSFTSQGNAAVPANLISTNAFFGNNNFWSQNLIGKPSFGFSLAWDIYPEHQGTVIGPYDDRGKGTLKITFDQPVYNPKLHLDRLGGAGTNYYTMANSAELTLLTPGITMTKESGTDDFMVTSTKINREVGITTNTGTEAHQSRNVGTSAGTVKCTGLVNELVFEWTGIGVEGIGYDGIEMILEYCAENSDSINVPNFDFVVNNNCPTQTVNFINTSINPGAGVTYHWDFGDGNTSAESNPSHVYASVGNYVVTLEMNDGQGSTKTIHKTVTISSCNNCSLTVDYIFPPVVCYGNSLEFINSSANITSQTTFVWDVFKRVSNGTWDLVERIHTSGTSSLNYAFSSLGEYQLVLTGTDPSCDDKRSKIKEITVTEGCCSSSNDLAGADQTICPGSVANIGSAELINHSYSWTPSTGLDCSYCGETTATPSATTLYTLTVTTPNCSEPIVDHVLVTVGDSPIAVAGEDQAICELSVATVGNKDQGIAGNVYNWSPATGLDCVSCAETTANPSVTTVYTLTVSNPNCTNTAADMVVVKVGDSPLAAAGEDRSICGESITTIGTKAQADNEYSWSPTTGLGCANCAETTANPSVTTVYTLTVSNPNCANSAIDHVLVTVGDAPLANAGKDKVICSNGVTTIGTAYEPGNVYSWSPATGLECSNCAFTKAKPTETTVYTLTVSNLNCSNVSVDEVVVKVGDSPLANSGIDKAICTGSEGTTIGTVGQSGNVYNWSPSTGLGCTDCAETSANPAETTVYTLTVSNQHCTNTAVDKVVVRVGDSPLAVAGEDQAICGESVATIGTQKQDGNQYSWSPVIGLGCAECAETSAKPSETKVYTLTVSNPHCANTATDHVVVTVGESPLANAGMDKTICSGSATTIGTAEQGDNVYSWSPVTGLDCADCALTSANPTETTVYTLTVNNPNCSNTAVDEVVVKVGDSPLADAGMNQVICPGPEGTTIGTEDQAGNVYSWNPVTGLDCADCAETSANPTETTVYTLTVSNPNCSNASTDQVVVKIGDSPFVDAGMDKAICHGSEGTVIGTEGQPNNVYSWSPATGLDCADCAVTLANPTETTVYTLTVSNLYCSNKAVGHVIVTVGDSPLADAGMDKAICLGSEGPTIGKEGERGNVYSWNPVTGLDCPECAVTKVNISETAVYTLTVSNPNCPKTTIDEVKVSVGDSPLADAGKDKTICAGSTVTIGTQAQEGNEYTWYPAIGMECNNCAQIEVNPIETTLYHLTVRNPNCSKPGTDQVLVTVADIPIIDVGEDQVICTDEKAVIGSEEQEGNIYSWSPATDLDCSKCAKTPASPSLTTVYTLTISNPNCANMAVDEVEVKVGDSPIANAGEDKMICAGMKVTIGVGEQDGNEYSWSPADGLDCTNCAETWAHPTETTVYTLTVTNPNCSNTSTDLVVVTVGDSPSINAGNDQLICNGAIVKIGETAQEGNVYSWSPTDNLLCGNCSEAYVKPSTTTLYTLTVSNPYCSKENADEVLVQVSTPSATISPSQEICSGNEVRLEASGGIVYTWSPSTGLSASNIPNPMASPSSTTHYNVSILDGNGCIIEKDVVVIVSPPLNIDAGEDITGCVGEKVTLHASGAENYLWSPAEGLSCNNCPNPEVTINGNITYTAEGASGNCEGSDEVSILLNPIYDVDFTYHTDGCNITLEAFPEGFNYKWTIDHQPITGVGSTVTHQFLTHGKHLICVEIEGPCNNNPQACQLIEIKAEDCNCCGTITRKNEAE